MSDSLKNEAHYDQDRLERFVWAQQQTTGRSRRDILKQAFGLAATAASAGFLGNTASNAWAQSLPPIVKPTPADKFRTLGTNRETLFEAHKGQGYLTPASLFFIRNHTTTPRIDPAAWSLRIEGTGVTNPRSFTLDDLLAYPPVSLTRFIECAGNGRSFYATQQGANPAASGTQWRLGAIGVGNWTGVRLSTLLQAAGVKPSAVDVQPEGLDDIVSPTVGRVRRALPIQRALEDDVLVVYGLNGELLPQDHGFPARLLVPGWIGIANIKWIGRIEVSETPLFSAFNTTQYKYFGAAYPDEPVLTRQVVKSAFELPFPATLPSGLNLITGRSWSANGTIARVDVSFDDGSTWRRAVIKQGGNGTQAWAEWQIPWVARTGTHALKARATDNLGNTQPDTVPFNTQGYLFSAVVRHPVNVT
ncbi:MAG: sulfite oxidase [Burkholderiales bacterium]|nr:sulfite oxidase [Burkholderiales bacterium]